MSLSRQLARGLRSLFQGKKVDRDLADEVEHYFEEARAELMANGNSEQEARRIARLQSGTTTHARDQVRSSGWEQSLRSFAFDLRFAARQLVKHKAFAATAVATLALGIGANTAIFTVVQSVLLAPLPYPDANRIVALQTKWTDSGHVSLGVTGPDGEDVRLQAHALEAVSLYQGGESGVQLRDHAVFTLATGVDANFSRVFNLQPLAGRVFTDADAHHAAMVSETFARDNFGSNQSALGQTIRVEGEVLEIVGILPRSFDFPRKSQVWGALPLRPESRSRTAFNYRAVGKLAAGVTPETSQAELDNISRRLESTYPVDNRKKQMIVLPMQQALTGKSRPTLLLLSAAVAVILLIACVNVTHLQLVRSMERRRELSIRAALGSSPWQLMRPVIAESLLLSLLGGLVGIAGAAPTVHLLLALAPPDLPRVQEIHINPWVLLFTLALSLFTTLISSLLPAWRATKADPSEALKQDITRGMIQHRATALRNSLVVAEVAATFVLTVSAGLLLRTMASLFSRDMGYQTARLLVVDTDAPAHTVDDAKQVARQYEQLFTQLSALPGVERVAGIMGLPASKQGSNGYYSVKGAPAPVPGQEPWAYFSVASSGYFHTMGIPFKRGRDFAAQDSYDRPFVAVISESLARQSFGEIDPIGRQIQCGLDSDQWMTVIGVVSDVRQDSPAAKPGPTLYMPMSQHPFYATGINIVVRTGPAPLLLMNAVRNKITLMNPEVAMRFTTMDTMVGDSIGTERFRAALLSSFAGIGLLLAMLGVYGTISYSVAQQRFEIGVRMAFGAEKSTILRMILGHAATLAAAGLVVGLALSVVAARLIATMLVDVKPVDPVSLAAAASLLTMTALLAAFAPALRAARVNPVTALRAE